MGGTPSQGSALLTQYDGFGISAQGDQGRGGHDIDGKGLFVFQAIGVGDGGSDLKRAGFRRCPLNSSRCRIDDHPGRGSGQAVGKCVQVGIGGQDRVIVGHLRRRRCDGRRIDERRPVQPGRGARCRWTGGHDVGKLHGIIGVNGGHRIQVVGFIGNGQIEIGGIGRGGLGDFFKGERIALARPVDVVAQRFGKVGPGELNLAGFRTRCNGKSRYHSDLDGIRGGALRAAHGRKRDRIDPLGDGHRWRHALGGTKGSVPRVDKGVAIGVERSAAVQSGRA
jgi:hypothetical protein